MIPDAVAAVDPECDRAAVAGICAFLSEAYREAAGRVDETGYRRWAPCLVHGDWHPGNLLYQQRVVVSVLDFDSGRLENRMADVANAALQFSMKMGKVESPEDWPDGLSIRLMKGLLIGYNQAAPRPITPEERRALPWLMIEALILESVLPIARVGLFGQINGLTFLQMVERKIRWIKPHVEKIVSLTE